MDLKPGQLGFTFCKVPVIYSASDKNELKVSLINGETVVMTDPVINAEISTMLFNRDGEVVKIELSIATN